MQIYSIWYRHSSATWKRSHEHTHDMKNCRVETEHPFASLSLYLNFASLRNPVFVWLSKLIFLLQSTSNNTIYQLNNSHSLYKYPSNYSCMKSPAIYCLERELVSNAIGVNVGRVGGRFITLQAVVFAFHCCVNIYPLMKCYRAEFIKQPVYIL